MLRHNLWHALNTVWQLNLEAVSLHAYTSLPATPLADGHDRGDRRHDPMRGLGNAGQYAAAPHRDGDGAGRQRLRGGRQALPFRAREVRRGGATSLDRWFGKNRRVAARSALGRERRPDARRRRWRREYARPRILGHRCLRAVVVVPQERGPGRGGRWLARPQDCDRAARQRDARAVAGTVQAFRDGAADRRTLGARPE